MRQSTIQRPGIRALALSMVCLAMTSQAAEVDASKLAGAADYRDPTNACGRALTGR